MEAGGALIASDAGPRGRAVCSLKQVLLLRGRLQVQGVAALTGRLAGRVNGTVKLCGEAMKAALGARLGHWHRQTQQVVMQVNGNFNLRDTNKLQHSLHGLKVRYR